jgi:hypothetical protein
MLYFESESGIYQDENLIENERIFLELQELDLNNGEDYYPTWSSLHPMYSSTDIPYLSRYSSTDICSFSHCKL